MSDTQARRWLAGRYELERRIGTGGTAEVWRAWRLKADGTRQRVAVKRVLPQFAGQFGAVERLDREAALCEGLSHTNVIKVLDYIRDADDVRWIVMEYVDGLHLGQLCKATLVANEPLRTILDGSLAGLDHLHMNGILHRDISPGNIMITRQGVVKLTDLGFAREAGQPPSHLSQGRLVGTIAYSSLEALQGDELDASSDLYSLAATFFRVLTGRCPYGTGGVALNEWNQTQRNRRPLPDEVGPDFRVLFDGLLVQRDERVFRAVPELRARLVHMWGPSFPGAEEHQEVAALVEQAMARCAEDPPSQQITVRRRVTIPQLSENGERPVSPPLVVLPDAPAEVRTGANDQPASGSPSPASQGIPSGTPSPTYRELPSGTPPPTSPEPPSGPPATARVWRRAAMLVALAMLLLCTSAATYWYASSQSSSIDYAERVDRFYHFSNPHLSKASHR